MSDFSDVYYLNLADNERANSDDPKARINLQSAVGALIIQNNTILSKSSNVLPPKIKAASSYSTESVRYDERYFFIEHAERAAIFQALVSGLSLEGATMYCTRFPCSDCARAIIWAGIRRIVTPIGVENSGNWKDSQQAAERMLRTAEIELFFLQK